MHITDQEWSEIKHTIKSFGSRGYQLRSSYLFAGITDFTWNGLPEYEKQELRESWRQGREDQTDMPEDC